MKIYLPNDSRQGIGGGWTFMDNIRDAMDMIEVPVEFVGEGEDYDIMLICGSSMVNNRGTIKTAIRAGKKIILRIDNIPRNSRNRRTGTPKLFDYANWADWVVFQSVWAKDKILPLISASRARINQNNNELYGWGSEEFRDHFKEARSSIILNGVNTEIYKADGAKVERPEGTTHQYIIVRYNRDNNKRLEEALDIYTKMWLTDKNINLWLVGQFSDKLRASDFDFYLGESYQFKGVFDDREEMAMYLRSADYLIYPSYSDACPNVVLEARASGCHTINKGHAGILEALDPGLDITLQRMGQQYLDLFNKLME